MQIATNLLISAGISAPPSYIIYIVEVIIDCVDILKILIEIS